jgi:hypothetical protein
MTMSKTTINPMIPPRIHIVFAEPVVGVALMNYAPWPGI